MVTASLILVVSSVALSSTSSDDDQAPSLASRSLPAAKWLYERGPFDPRPYDDGVLFDGLLTREYFEGKNTLWRDDGISIGGYFSANTQWGSRGGPAHSMSETLLLVNWEPLRTDTTVGRLVTGFAHDWTFGRPTTREFADRQGLVETPNDLDTDPDLTFTTLGLFHWEQEIYTGTGQGVGFRLGQLYAPFPATRPGATNRASNSITGCRSLKRSTSRHTCSTGIESMISGQERIPGLVASVSHSSTERSPSAESSI